MNPNFADQVAALPRNLGAHVALTGAALAIGVSTSLPLGVLSARSPRARVPLLAFASLVQTVPSLALLALMVPLLGAFGLAPALLALTVYSMLPVLRNTVTGITNVEPELVEVAYSLGMTKRDVLFRVELPLALSVIVAGVRTAAAWVVGVATLSTPVGQPSLGNYIFGGLQTRNWTAVLFGCVAAAVLALGLDALLALLEKAARRKSRVMGALGVAGLAVVFGAGASASRSSARVSSVDPVLADVPMDGSKTLVHDEVTRVRVGAKTFTEQYILAALLERRLEAAGFTVERAESLGSTVAFDALRANQIDVYVDYTGTLWTGLMKRSDVLPAWRIRAELSSWLAVTCGVRNLGALGFENAYVLATHAEVARRLPAPTIAALALAPPALRFGSDYEFLSRAEWQRLKEAYGLRFSSQTNFDPAFLYEALVRRDVDVISAFSSDGRIGAYGLVVLEDTKQALPPYDAVVLLSPRVASEPRVAAALRPLVGGIGVDKMREANGMVDRESDKRTPREAAAWLDATIR